MNLSIVNSISKNKNSFVENFKMASNLRFTVFVVLSTVIIFSFLVNGDDDKPIAPQKPTAKNNTKTCSAEIGKKIE